MDIYPIGYRLWHKSLAEPRSSMYEGCLISDQRNSMVKHSHPLYPESKRHMPDSSPGCRS